MTRADELAAMAAFEAEHGLTRLPERKPRALRRMFVSVRPKSRTRNAGLRRWS